MTQKVLSYVLAMTTVLSASGALAQSSTSGAVKGVVTDRPSGAGVAGVTIVAVSPALQGQQAEVSDTGGGYYLTNLPPGTYTLTFYYDEIKVNRENVIIQVGKVAQVNIAIDTSRTGGEVITIVDSTPVIDQGSTKTGTTITNDYTRNVPTGRTFAGVLEAAPGAQADTYGVSFGGSTSPENVYIVDGLNTTDPAFGLLDVTLPNEFIQETEIITGAYSAEFGRATGGVVNVVTKSGGNEFHGSVYSTFSPGALDASPRAIPREGSSIELRARSAYDVDLGAEVGGPIIKDKLWFHVGFNPRFTSTNYDRIVSTNVDEDGDGVPDVDPETGFTRLEEVERRTISRPSQRYYYTGKVSFAASEHHQGSLSIFGNPGTRDDIYTEFVGPKEATQIVVDSGSLDLTGRWTSKFANNKSQVEAVLGLHRGRIETAPEFASGGTDSTIQIFYPRPYTDFANFEDVPAACMDDGGDDPYPMTPNCPVSNYQLGGIGFLSNEQTQRLAGKVAFTQRLRGVGYHIIKVGADFEDNRYSIDEAFPGGAFYQDFGGDLLAQRFYTVDDDGDTACGSDFDGDFVGNGTCVSKPEGLSPDTRTINLGAFLQESWQPIPNLTINAGLRWEQQRLKSADDVVGKKSGATGELIGEDAFILNHMFAPRVGAIYDPTKEGKSRIFGHWGRFYESIPMDINSRGFGGEVLRVTDQFADQCDNVLMPTGFSCETEGAPYDVFLGGGDTLVAPNLKAQYLDEYVIGGEYEVITDLKVGLSFIHRGLGRVIEDISTDGGTTYIVSNPGEAVSQSDIDELRARADAATDEELANALNFQADQFEGIGTFDKPSRTYDAIQLTASKRFSRAFMVQGSYVYSKTRGNFPGLFSPDTGQLDPNGTSMYDLPELMANRYGDLPQDRPHLVKIDGYYALDLKRTGTFVLGGSIRAQSGHPHDVLGSSPAYGPDETFILPRGEGARGPFSTSLDLHLAYGRKLAAQMTLEAFVEVFNVFDQQTTDALDETYTYDTVNPIVGGDETDLQHLKAIDYNTGLTTSTLAFQNPNFGKAKTALAPRFFRFGLRLLF